MIIGTLFTSLTFNQWAETRIWKIDQIIPLKYRIEYKTYPISARKFIVRNISYPDRWIYAGSFTFTADLDICSFYLFTHSYICNLLLRRPQQRGYFRSPFLSKIFSKIFFVAFIENILSCICRKYILSHIRVRKTCYIDTYIYDDIKKYDMIYR